MQEVEQALLQAFATAPDKNFLTTELVALVFPEDYAALRDGLHNNDKETRKHAQRQKTRLHRKLLYYLNKLENKGILEVSGIEARGEKTYRLQTTASEYIVETKNNTITIHREEKPTRYTTHYEENKTIYTRSTALHTIDAYAINAQKYPGIAHLRAELTHAYAHINDAILIQNAHTLLELPQEAISAGIAQLKADTQDYNVAITLHIDLTAQQLSNQHIAFFHTLTLHKPNRLYLLFSTTEKELRQQHAITKTVFELLTKNKIKITVHNKQADNNTHFFGEAGAYKLTTEQEKKLQEHKATIVTNTSLLIDCQRISNAKEHETLLEAAAKTLLAHVTAQRRSANKALAGIARISPLHAQIRQPTATIRYYNFELEETFIQQLTSRKQQLQQFSEIHNRIYSSCGVPIDLHLQLSTGFIHYADIPIRRYKKTAVKNKQDLEKQHLKEREELLGILDTDRLRIFRETPVTGNELINEITYLLTRYNHPLICYDAKTLQTTLSLQEFLQ
ncbi:MAG: hypothetical protein ACMXYD_04625 [Candidatus Woesearchaeota archaeon]